ncbi:uncharacterized protein G2W53_005938 [Senna tora]|uniref:Uncharacterized protein n=1 Tax=Senna tora TaxID=362788 RepID=A0A834X348_9FABA|nr:uncharacterized protein G2W53_005938 [Senna tora]
MATISVENVKTGKRREGKVTGEVKVNPRKRVCSREGCSKAPKHILGCEFDR